MTRHRHSLRPSLEGLEARDTPATAAGGTVTATFAAGRLTVSGDAAANIVLLTQEPDGRLALSGNGSGTQVRLNGGPVGAAVTLPAPVTGRVTINLGDGVDQLTVNGVDLPGSLSINGGNGAGDGPDGNYVRLLEVHVGGSLTITNLAGADTTFLAGVVAVRGGLTVRNGPGDSTVWGDYTTDLHVGGVFSVSAGAGHDIVDLWGVESASAGGLAFNSGTDHDGSSYQLHPFGDLTVVGGVQITNGPGSDGTDLGGQNLTVGGAVVVRNGDGGSSTVLLAEAGMSVGSVTVTNGAGFDDNSIESRDTARIRGGVRFANGPGIGHNTIFANNLLSVAGNVAYVNGSADGLHLNTVGGWDTRIAGALTIRNGDGDTDTSVAGDGRIWIGGPTRIISGDGYDQTTVGASRVANGDFPAADLGPVQIDNGDGGSETVVLGGRLTVRGPVDVAAWGGTDAVVVASAYDSGSVSGHVFVDVGPGDQQLVAVGSGDGRVLTIGGGLGVWTADADGADTVSLAGVDARSWTEVWTGGGADLVRETDSTFRGSFDLDTGAGDDEVYLEWTGAATSFAGPVWVSTGDGNDGILVGGDPEAPGQVTFTGASHWNGGAGAQDVLVVRYTGGVFLGPDPVLSGFEVAF
jgi:hypothetical protein